MSIADPLYGVFILPATLETATAHPAVARLGRIKQLGFSVYNDARLRHTRLEHSRGVAYLLGIAATALQFDAELRETVMMAGLLHDDGHGAYSHAFEYVTPQRHEERSQQIARLVLKEVYTQQRIEEVCYLIDPRGAAPSTRVEPARNLVANKVCHVDCDKLDYCLRDAHYAEQPFCTVAEVFSLLQESKLYHGVWTFAVKHAPFMRRLFEQRERMFALVYHHPSNLLAEAQMLRAVRQLPAQDWSNLATFLQYDDDSFLALLTTTPAGQALARGDYEGEALIPSKHDEQTPALVLPLIPYYD